MRVINPAPGEWTVGTGHSVHRFPCMNITREHLEEALLKFVGHERGARPAEDGNEISAELMARAGAKMIWQILSEMADEPTEQLTINGMKQD